VETGSRQENASKQKSRAGTLHEFVRPDVKIILDLESGEQIGGLRDKCEQA
jgi:hypothetical protein